MSFTGDLEHLPIVDVIQLIYSTKKSGTLSIKSLKGESQLVFVDGFFVSANHLNNSVRIGQILIENNALSQESLESALLEQKNAGPDRRPLVATLISRGVINREEAYKGLETLIEMTIVEVLSRTSGTFTMDVSKTDMCDEFRYFSEMLQQKILMNAQGLLMDALRIYDEKMRDGTLDDIFLSSGDDENQTSDIESGDRTITADLLGLDALDSLSKKIPDVFNGLKENDSSEEHCRIVSEELGTLSVKARERLCSFLNQFPVHAPVSARPAATDVRPLTVIVFSHDSFIKHAVSTVCRSRNIIVFTTDDDASLGLIIEQSFSRNLLPVLIIDAPGFLGGEFSEEEEHELILHKRKIYPGIALVKMSISPSERSFPSAVLDGGTDIEVSRPVLREDPDSFVEHMINFLQGISHMLDRFFIQQDQPAQPVVQQFRDCISGLGKLTEPQQVARELLQFSSGFFERSLLFVVGAAELTAEKGIGITAGREKGPTGPLKFKIPLDQESVFSEVIHNRLMYFGSCSDTVLSSQLYSAIPAPLSSEILVLPLVMFGRAIALIYADFGMSKSAPVQTDQLEIFAQVVGIVLERSYYRKKFEKLTHPH